MSRRLRGVSRIVLVASGKGGVGKTTATVNLALALAQGSARVGLFDADVHGPNVPLMLGVPGISEKESAALTIPLGRANDRPYIHPLERLGIAVMSVGLLVADTDTVRANASSVGLLVVQTLRDVLWGQLDYLLVDLPPGTGEPQQSLLGAFEVDGVIFVTTPQDLSLMDTGRSLGLFRAAGVPILGYVENMAYLDCPHCGEPIEVFRRSARRWEVHEALEPLGRVPLRPDIEEGGHIVRAPFAQIAARVAGKLASS